MMIRSLKEIVIPTLRSKGFRGSFPHFRRLSAGQLDLLSFQFNQYGGGFVVELSYCPAGGFVASWGKTIPEKDVNVWYMHPNRRIRLGSTPGAPDHWFRYDASPSPANVHERLAREVLTLIDSQAEPWWSERRGG